jgi:C4-dicarboxylate transporter, DctM subunit
LPWWPACRATSTSLAHTLLAHRRGGLALATIGGCAGFGALTGSSLATVATIGRVALPEMNARGYSVSLSTGSVAAGGTLGALVPPSIPLIFYALLTEQSIGQLFIAAVIPAVIAVVFYLAAISLTVRLVPGAAPAKQERANPQEILRAFRRAWAALTLLAVVVVSIYTGICTETEAAAIGTGGAFLFALARGRINRASLLQVMGETTATTALIYLIIFGVLVFSFSMGVTGLPARLTAFVESPDLGPIAVLGFLLVVYLLLGAIMDSNTVMFVTVPIVTPLDRRHGLRPRVVGHHQPDRAGDRADQPAVRHPPVRAQEHRRRQRAARRGLSRRHAVRHRRPGEARAGRLHPGAGAMAALDHDPLIARMFHPATRRIP